jgi:hypothetical protein
MYTAEFPYTTGEMVKIFFDNHDCDSTKLQQAIERVRELHKPVTSYKGMDNDEIIGCIECEETGSGREYWVEYPCPTIKALYGETDEA